jgi:ABC-type polar amino acid transport system ATPase subunit
MFPLLMSRHVIRSSTTLNITRNRKRKYVGVKGQGKSMLLSAMRNIERQYKIKIQKIAINLDS